MKILTAACLAALLTSAHSAPLSTIDALSAALQEATEGAVVEIGAGTFELGEPLRVSAGVTLRGAGTGKTVIAPAPGWIPSTRSLPDPETKTEGLDSEAYLIRLDDKAAGITISGLSLDGKAQVHGAIYGFGNSALHLHNLEVSDVLASGIRTLSTRGAKIHDCTFTDAGGRWKRGGIPGTDGGITGGAIFAAWLKDAEIWNNRFVRTRMEKEREFCGIKARQGKRVRIHHNTIEVNFSIEFPFENDEDVEIDHNILLGTVSLPKHGGGPVPESGRTFHLHHNYFTNSYAIEFPRNGIEIDHNLFDFAPDKDHGNLISGFGGVAAPGPASFHHNLVSTPGRGILWIDKGFGQLDIHHNHIIARTTATPREDGLFGLNNESDFATISVRDNIIECIGTPRPLFRNDTVGSAVTVTNNALTNVADTARYKNRQTSEPQGLESPLTFKCGVGGEMEVDGWETR